MTKKKTKNTKTHTFFGHFFQADVSVWDQFLPGLPLSKLSISVRTLASFPGDAGECCISTGWVTGLDIVPAAATTFKGKGQPALPFSQRVRKWIQRHQIWTWKYNHRHCNAGHMVGRSESFCPVTGNTHGCTAKAHKSITWCKHVYVTGLWNMLVSLCVST